MKIDVYSIMKNEIRMLPYFLRHYGEIADRIFVWDDQSDDGTLEMLKAHPKVILLHLDVHGTDDDYARFYLWPQYQKISRGIAEWVIQVDADEFVYREFLSLKLSGLRHRKFDVIYPTGYLMMAEKFPTTSGQIYEEVRYGVRDKTMDKPVIFNPEIDIYFRGGRHRTEYIGRRDNLPVKKCHDSKIMYLHFRYFGIDYFNQRFERNAVANFNSGTDYGKSIYPFSLDQKWRMPDRTYGKYHEWFSNNKDKVVKVI
jgi:hypothetical protein